MKNYIIPDPAPIVESAEEAQAISLQTESECEEFVPDNCSNCPDSSCCRHARDTFNGNRRNRPES